MFINKHNAEEGTIMLYIDVLYIYSFFLGSYMRASHFDEPRGTELRLESERAADLLMSLFLCTEHLPPPPTAAHI